MADVCAPSNYRGKEKERSPNKDSITAAKYPRFICDGIPRPQNRRDSCCSSAGSISDIVRCTVHTTSKAKETTV